jgi:molybdenum cofactor biosynthesis enzyme MoaA
MDNQSNSIDASQLPPEFDIIKTGKGYTMHGWDFTREELAAAINAHQMLNPAIELGTNYCPWNCGFCFTEEPGNPEGEKRRLSSEMSIEKRLTLIDEAAALGAKAINFVGAGEPTIDPDFWKLVERMQSRSIVPIVYTEAALRLTDKAFARRLYEAGATVVVKVNSLWDEAYQNAIVAGPPGRKRPRSENYTQLRNQAIAVLVETGFASHDPTRLAFDTIICRQNIEEIPRLHRWARERNIFILFVNYLPSGRSTDGLHDALSREEQFKLFGELADIDAKEYGIQHDSRFPYAGGTPCHDSWHGAVREDRREGIRLPRRKPGNRQRADRVSGKYLGTRSPDHAVLRRRLLSSREVLGGSRTGSQESTATVARSLTSPPRNRVTRNTESLDPPNPGSASISRDLGFEILNL